jgi:hypothetical protein
MLRFIVIVICAVLCIPFFYRHKTPQERMEWVIEQMKIENKKSVELYTDMSKSLVKLNADMERLGLNE